MGKVESVAVKRLGMAALRNIMNQESEEGPRAVRMTIVTLLRADGSVATYESGYGSKVEWRGLRALSGDAPRGEEL